MSNVSSIPGTNVPPVSFPGIASGIDYNSIIQKLTSMTLAPTTQLNQQIATLNAANAELVKINGLLSLHGFELANRLRPHLAVVFKIGQQSLDADRILLHVRHDQFVMPELVHAEEIAGNLAADLHVERSHQQRECALGTQQRLVDALDVVALILQFVERLRRRKDEDVENFDDEVFLRSRRNRRFQILLFGRTFHRYPLLAAAARLEEPAELLLKRLITRQRTFR
jgi:hypothetical protein